MTQFDTFDFDCLRLPVSNHIKPRGHVTRGRADEPDRRIHLQSESTNTCSRVAVNFTELKIGLPRKFTSYKTEDLMYCL